MKRLSIILISFIVFTLPSCAQKKVLYKNTVRCLNTELDGSETLRITGYGRNRDDAKEQAIKNAVYVVIFEGVKYGSNGNNGTYTHPLITETAAREKYAEYFDIFFMDGGEYRKYASLADTKRRSMNKTKTKLGTAYEMTVRVLRPQLKLRLQQDNILPR